MRDCFWHFCKKERLFLTGFCHFCKKKHLPTEVFNFICCHVFYKKRLYMFIFQSKYWSKDKIVVV
jgi:hypothetical protein